jgi:hypothetical protein
MFRYCPLRYVFDVGIKMTNENGDDILWRILLKGFSEGNIATGLILFDRIQIQSAVEFQLRIMTCVNEHCCFTAVQQVLT